MILSEVCTVIRKLGSEDQLSTMLVYWCWTNRCNAMSESTRCHMQCNVVITRCDMLAYCICTISRKTKRKENNVLQSPKGQRGVRINMCVKFVYVE